MPEIPHWSLSICGGRPLPRTALCAQTLHQGKFLRNWNRYDYGMLPLAWLLSEWMDIYGYHYGYLWTMDINGEDALEELKGDIQEALLQLDEKTCPRFIFWFIVKNTPFCCRSSKNAQVIWLLARPLPRFWIEEKLELFANHSWTSGGWCEMGAANTHGASVATREPVNPKRTRSREGWLEINCSMGQIWILHDTVWICMISVWYVTKSRCGFFFKSVYYKLLQ